MPTRKRKARVKHQPVTTLIRLDSAAVAALDALDNAEPPIYPYGLRGRAGRIRWLICNFESCYSRLHHAHAVAADRQRQLDNLRMAVAPLAAAMRALNTNVDAFTAAPLDAGDLEFPANSRSK